MLYLSLKKLVIVVYQRFAIAVYSVCMYRPEELPADFYKVSYDMESAVKRKTLLKNGKKPSVSTCAISYQ